MDNKPNKHQHLPGVTTILSPFGGIEDIPIHILKSAASRGSRVHEAIAKYLLKEYAFENATDNECKPFFDVAKSWIDHNVQHVISVEEHFELVFNDNLPDWPPINEIFFEERERLYRERPDQYEWGYQGYIDLVAILDKKAFPKTLPDWIDKNKPVQIDWKTSKRVQCTWGLQSIAYRKLLYRKDPINLKTDVGMCIRLNPTSSSGTISTFYPYSLWGKEWQVFEKMGIAYTFLCENGYKNKYEPFDEFL